MDKAVEKIKKKEEEKTVLLPSLEIFCNISFGLAQNIAIYVCFLISGIEVYCKCICVSNFFPLLFCFFFTRKKKSNFFVFFWSACRFVCMYGCGEFVSVGGEMNTFPRVVWGALYRVTRCINSVFISCEPPPHPWACSRAPPQSIWSSCIVCQP